MNYYHFTHKRNLNKIMIEGLMVNPKGVGLVQRPRYHQRFGCRPIFVTNNPEYVLRTMISENNNHEFILLRITCDLSCKVIPESHFYYNSPYLDDKTATFVCFHNIEPESLEIVDKNFRLQEPRNILAECV